MGIDRPGFAFPLTSPVIALLAAAPLFTFDPAFTEVSAFLLVPRFALARPWCCAPR
jgi:hypothetical protein